MDQADGDAGLLREAVRLWRGETLAGLAGEWASSMRAAWDTERLLAVVAWAGAELEAGDPAAVIGPLGATGERRHLVEVGERVGPAGDVGHVLVRRVAPEFRGRAMGVAASGLVVSQGLGFLAAGGAVEAVLPPATVVGLSGLLGTAAVLAVRFARVPAESSHS
uniref:bacterial transcriptional activator domain-containing protein n=1 Tax=Paractinoplanes polyasparticus TaxID=2856853 RepID=UPI001C84538D|nr:bacterial transcriptional activator domain-containing protein [Actinoplanes polyasparticus]